MTPDPKPTTSVKGRAWTCRACGEKNRGVKSCVKCRTRKTSRVTTGIDKRLDTALRRYTLDRAAYMCERCGLTRQRIEAMGGQLQDAHYEKRGKKAVRWHPDNRAALCAEYPGACHSVIDTYTPAAERRAFFAAVRGEAAIFEVDALVRAPWDKDRAAVMELLRRRGIRI